MSPEDLEGRLIAHRQVLARLVAANGADLREFLRDRSTVAIPEEDPSGDGPDPAFAIEAALADEMRRLTEAVDRLD